MTNDVGATKKRMQRGMDRLDQTNPGSAERIKDQFSFVIAGLNSHTVVDWQQVGWLMEEIHRHLQKAE